MRAGLCLKVGPRSAWCLRLHPCSHPSGRAGSPDLGQVAAILWFCRIFKVGLEGECVETEKTLTEDIRNPQSLELRPGPISGRQPVGGGGGQEKDSGRGRQGWSSRADGVFGTSWARWPQ